MNINEVIESVEERIQNIIDSCPHCGAKVHIEKLWSDYHSLKNGDLEFYIVFRCKPCQKLLLKTLYFRENKYNRDNYKVGGWNEKFPISLDTELSKKDSEYIPEQVFADYNEALKCKSIGANRASCSMFRRSLQNGLLELGANDKENLISQINSLESLPKEIKDWSHQIRIIGNWGAHPDKDNLKDVDKDNVEDVHSFISNFLTYMFIMPQKVLLSRKKIDKKKENLKNNQK